jgi:tetratricopeptide (TPR) repeat protein
MQKSFADLEYAAKKKLTRRDRFLAEIDSVTPWGKLHRLVEPFYPKVAGAGRPPIGLARMLRMYVAQQCFGLSDEGIEDAIYDSQAIRAFVGIDLGRESAPDVTTLLKFRHLLEAKDQALLAGALQRQQRHREAAEQYQAALRAQPGNGVWWMGLGISLQAGQRNAEALDAFQKAKAAGTLGPELQAFVERRLAQLSR